MEIIFTLIKNDPTQFMWLFQDMDDLVPVYPDPEGEWSRSWSGWCGRKWI